MFPFAPDILDWLALLCGLMLPDWLVEFCELEPFCEFMSEVEEDWLWLLLEEEFEVLCAAAASVNTRNANKTSNVVRFIFPQLPGTAGG